MNAPTRLSLGPSRYRRAEDPERRREDGQAPNQKDAKVIVHERPPGRPLKSEKEDDETSSTRGAQQRQTTPQPARARRVISLSPHANLSVLRPRPESTTLSCERWRRMPKRSSAPTCRCFGGNARMLALHFVAVNAVQRDGTIMRR